MNSFWLNVFKIANKFSIFAIVFLYVSTSNKIISFAEECVHANVTFGLPINGQTLIKDRIICDNGSLFGSDVRFKYPDHQYIKWTPGFKHYNANISQVIVMNLHKGCDCREETFKIKSGGIGKSSIELEVSAWVFCPNCHKFLVYNNTRWYR